MFKKLFSSSILLLIPFALLAQQGYYNSNSIGPAGWYTTNPALANAKFESTFSTSQFGTENRYIPIYNKDKVFYTEANGNGPSFTFADQGKYNDSDNCPYYTVDPFYLVGTDPTQNSAVTIIPRPSQEGSFVLSQSYYWEGRLCYDGTTSGTAIAKLISVTIEVPELINTNQLSTLCTNSGTKDLQTYVKSGITGVVFTLQGSTVSQLDPSTLSPGTYAITATKVYDNGTWSTSFNITIVYQPTATITASGPTTFCKGGNVTLTAPAAPAGQTYTYVWSTGETSQSITVSESNYYTVTVNNGGCVTTSPSVSITALPVPDAQISLISGGTEICEGEGTVLQSSQGKSYIWFNEKNEQVGIYQIYTALVTGSYRVQVTNNEGCSAVSNPVTIAVKPNPKPVIANSGASTFCEGVSVILTANVAGNPISYTWSNGKTGKSISVDVSGIYTVTVQNNAGCSSTSEPVVINVTSAPKPTITASGPTTICADQTVTLTATLANSYIWNTGETTRSITVNTGGQYYVTTTNSAGCQRESDRTTVTTKQNVKPTFIITGLTTFCEGSSSKFLISNPVSGASYLWSNGQTGTEMTVTESGSYYVVATYQEGCSSVSDIQAITVYPIPKPTISATSDLNICNFSTLILTVNEEATSYRWSTGETTRSITVGTTGSYTAYTKNAQGCERQSDPIFVNVKDNKAVAVSIIGNTTFCEGESVILTSSLGASYIWSTGETTRSITVKTSGSYNVEVTNNVGCKASSEPIIITVHPLPKPTVTIVGNTTFCQGESTILTINEIGAGYRWSTGETTKSITVTQSGTYYAYIQNAEGCERESTSIAITVTPNPIPVITLNGPTTFCEGGSVNLTTSLIAGSTYTWSNGASGNILNVTTSGTYYVTVTNAAGCSRISASVTVTVSPIPKPTIALSGSSTICQGDNITLTINETTASYRWSNGSKEKAITVTVGGTYFAYITNADGCERMSDGVTIVVNPNPKPVITANKPLTICEGEEILLTAPVSSAYLWSTGETTRQIKLIASTRVRVTTTNQYGCSNISDEVIVTVLTNPRATVSAKVWAFGTSPETDPGLGSAAAGTSVTTCSGDQVVLTASAGASFVWSTGENTQSIKVMISGVFKVVIFNANGCSQTSELISVTVNPKPVSKITYNEALTFCLGENVKLYGPVAPAGQVFTYYWSNGSAEKDLTVVASGDYTVTVTNQFGCSTTSDPVTVKVNPRPVATITSSRQLTFCEGDYTILSAPTAPQGQTYTYQWSSGEQTKDITVKTSGIYIVTVLNQYGCPSVSTPTTVKVNANPIATIDVSGPTTFCAGNIITLTASSGASYLWSNGLRTKSIDIAVSGTFSVKVTNEFGCSTTSEAITIKVNPLPTAKITALGVTEFCAGGSVILKATAGSFAYLWSNGAKDSTITVTKSGVYSVRVFNEFGCSEVSEAVTVIVREATPITPIADRQICINSGLTTLVAFPVGGKFTGSGMTQASFNPATAGLGKHTILYTYTNEYSCISTSTFVIEVTPLTIILPGADTTVCLSSSQFLLNGPIPEGTVISGTGVVGNQFVPSVAGLGKFTITYTFTNDYSCTTTAKRVITVNPNPTMPIVSGTKAGCKEEFLNLTAKSTITGNSEITYLWYKEGSTIPFYTGEKISYKLTKNEKLFVGAKSTLAASCLSDLTEVELVAYNPEGNYTASATTIPQGGFTTFTPVVIGAATYKWNFGDGISSNEQSPIHYYNTPGNFKVTMYAYSIQGCALVVEKAGYITVEDNAVAVAKPQPNATPVQDNNAFRENLVFPNPIVSGTTTIRFQNTSSVTQKGYLEIFTISGTLLLRKGYDVPPGSKDFVVDDLSVLSAKTYYIFMLNINNKKKPFKILIL